ncbi:hypothetical protein JYT44_01255 [Caldithrix abyssi]|nr:hypothetical protein [Caldithrix abyssi]
MKNRINHLLLLLIIGLGCEYNQGIKFCILLPSFTMTQQTDEQIYETNSLWKYASVVDPTIVELDGKYYRWYTGRGYSNIQVGLAMSDDGENRFESIAIDLKGVNWIEDGGFFKMLYSGKVLGENDNFYRSIGRAFSDNGINLTKDENNFIITYENDGDWNQNSTVAGIFIHEGNDCMVWFSGAGGSTRWNIGFL